MGTHFACVLSLLELRQPGAWFPPNVVVLFQAYRCKKCNSAGGSTASTCGTNKGVNNKMFAELLQYFTGNAEQDSTAFGVCVPTGVDFGSINADNLITTESKGDGVTTVWVNFLEAYSGVLAGVTDQPSVTFAFPPPSGSTYTWPLNKEKRLQWAAFNFPAGTRIKIKLMKGDEEISDMTKTDLENGTTPPVHTAHRKSCRPTAGARRRRTTCGAVPRGEESRLARRFSSRSSCLACRSITH